MFVVCVVACGWAKPPKRATARAGCMPTISSKRWARREMRLCPLYGCCAWGGITACMRTSRPSHLCQRRLHILDQIIGMFEPDREADEAFADAEFGARLRCQSLMRRRGGMGDEALGVAEIVRNPRQLQSVEEAERARLAAPDLEADQGRAGAHLFFHQSRLRMILSAGIDQAGDFRMVRQRLGDVRRRDGLGADANRQRLQPLQLHPGV